MRLPPKIKPAVKLRALFAVHEMPAPVLLPTGFVGLGAEWLFLAVADGLDAIGPDPSRDERILDGAGTAIPQSQIVFRRPAFVAVSFDGEAKVGMLLQESDVALHGGLLIEPDIGLVVIKVDIFDVLSEQLFVGKRS